MALNNSPKETLTAIQLLTEIALAVKEIKNLDDLAKKAHSLPEAEQKKADAAKEQIAAAQAGMDAVNKAKSALEKEAQAVAAKSKEADKKLEDAQTRSVALNAMEDELQAGFADLSRKQKTLMEDLRKLDAERQFLEERAKTLNEREAKIKEIEAGQKIKAEQIKAIMGA